MQLQLCNTRHHPKTKKNSDSRGNIKRSVGPTDDVTRSILEKLENKVINRSTQLSLCVPYKGTLRSKIRLFKKFLLKLGTILLLLYFS